MVKYLFVIFYLCVVMFLKLGHQLAKGKTSVSVSVSVSFLAVESNSGIYNRGVCALQSK